MTLNPTETLWLILTTGQRCNALVFDHESQDVALGNSQYRPR
jgi:hypothetical protein